MTLPNKRIEYVKNQMVQLESQEPLSEEKLNSDILLSESEEFVQANSTVRSNKSSRVKIPDLNNILGFGTIDIESGAAIIEGYGFSKIKFSSSFNSTPNVLSAKFGFLSIRIPTVSISMRSYTILGYSIEIPIPALDSFNVRLPSMCFVMDASSSGIQVFNVAGRVFFTYIAIGK